MGTELARFKALKPRRTHSGLTGKGCHDEHPSFLVNQTTARSLLALPQTLLLQRLPVAGIVCVRPVLFSDQKQLVTSLVATSRQPNRLQNTLRSVLKEEHHNYRGLLLFWKSQHSFHQRLISPPAHHGTSKENSEGD